MQQALEEKFYLPTTEAEFDALVDKVLLHYPQIIQKDHAIAVISVAIRHLPNDQAQSTIEYFGNTVIKALANHVANFKGEKIKHETQVTQAYDRLVSDPGDTQARDQLDKWANEGSIAAKDALNKIGSKDTQIPTSESNVLPFQGA